MFDQATMQLNETLYRERLQAAEAARQRRAAGGTTLSPIERLWQAIGQQLARIDRTQLYSSIVSRFV